MERMSFEGNVHDQIERREGQWIEDPTTRKPVMVLTTSDIQDIFEKKREGVEPNGTSHNNHFGREYTSYAYSRGVLEQALAAGYEVYVVTTRQEPFPTDRWWVALVGEDHVFWTPKSAEIERNEDRNSRFLAPYRKLFERLGVEFTWTGFHRQLLFVLPAVGIATCFSAGIEPTTR